MLHILVGDSADHRWLIRAADSERAVSWIVPKTAKPGDEAFFLLPAVGLAAVGHIGSRPKLDRRGFGGRRIAYRARVGKLRLLSYQVPICELRVRMPTWGWPRYPRSYTSADGALAKRVRLVVDRYVEKPVALEGIRREVSGYARSRSRRLRNQAVALSGGICDACGQNFSGVLGGLGVRVLQVHHRKQLAVVDRPRVNRLADLAVVCANCHVLIHADPRRAMRVEELGRRLREE